MRLLNSIIKQLRLCLLSGSFLGTQLDNKLNFSIYVSNICKSAANQLSVLTRLNNFLCFEGKRVLINSYFMSNFNYCPLVWMFSNATSLKKIENLQKWVLRFLYNNYQLSNEELLDKASSSTINVNISSRPEVFCKKGVLRNFAKFTGKHRCQSIFFNKGAGLSPATLLKKRLWHRCFPVNLAKLLRTPFLTKHLR